MPVIDVCTVPGERVREREKKRERKIVLRDTPGWPMGRAPLFTPEAAPY